MNDEKEHLIAKERPTPYSEDTLGNKQEGPHAYINNGYTTGEPCSSIHDITVAQIGRRDNDHKNVSEEGPPISVPVAIIKYNKPENPISLNGDTEGIEVIDVPPTYSGSSWLSCFFCCIPLAILAVFNSDQVEKSIKAGELVSAWRYSNRARKFTALAIIYGVLLIMACIALYVLRATVLHENTL